MASIQKRKDKYNVVYYYTDKYGKQKQKNGGVRSHDHELRAMRKANRAQTSRQGNDHNQVLVRRGI